MASNPASAVAAEAALSRRQRCCGSLAQPIKSLLIGLKDGHSVPANRVESLVCLGEGAQRANGGVCDLGEHRAGARCNLRLEGVAAWAYRSLARRTPAFHAGLVCTAGSVMSCLAG